jgi:predicted cobalt transporter CbtA
MLVGLVAGLLAFGFSRLFGEPQVDPAIAFEAAEHATHHNHAGMAHDNAAAPDPGQEEEELVSRPVQAGLGLFTGVVVFCTAFGGLFGLVFAVANGRMAGLGPRGVAALLAAAGFVAIHLVPSLKYPANPPAIGEADTIGTRTALYFLMILASLAAATAAFILRDRLAPRLGGWSAALWSLAFYAVIVAVAMLALPPLNDVPENFPADLLWQFRIASLGTQFVMWTTLGLGFGWLAERAQAVCLRPASV